MQVMVAKSLNMPPSVARVQFVVGFTDQTLQAPWYSVITNEPRSVVCRKLPIGPRRETGFPTPAETIRSMASGMAPGDTEVWIAVEGHPRRRTPERIAIDELMAAFPQARRLFFTIREVLASIGLACLPGEGFPPEGEIRASIQMRLGSDSRPASFWAAWTAAVAMAGAEQVWGSAAISLAPHAKIASHSAVVPKLRATQAGVSSTVLETRDLMTVDDVSRYVGRSRMWVYRHVRGKIPCVKPPGSRAVFYKRSDVEALVASWTAGVVEKSAVVIPITVARSRSRASSDVERSISRWGLRRATGKRKLKNDPSS